MTMKEFQIDPENESRARALAFAVAGVSFASSLAIAAFNSPGQWLIYASYCFAASLPLSLAQAFLSGYFLLGGWSTRSTRFLSVWLGLSSHLLVSGGVVLIFLHISGISAAIALLLGGLLWIFVVVYSGIYRSTCEKLNQK